MLMPRTASVPADEFQQEREVSRGYASQIGDTRVSPNGYQYTRTKNGWELTHKLIVERTLGRKLEKNERIRFKDKNRENLHPSNLVVTITTQKSKASRKARIEAKIADLQAELAEMERDSG